MRNRWILALLSLILTLTILVAGCGPSASTPSSQPAAQPTSATAKAPIKLTDAIGRTIELPGPAKRVMIVGQGPYMALHTLYMFPEARSLLIGWEQRGTSTDDFLPLIDPELGQKTVLNMNPNPEQIAALHPDLVILKGTTEDRLVKPLENLGIPTFQVALEQPEQFFNDIANIGVLIGNEARAEEIVSFYRTRLNRVQEQVAQIDEKARPRVLTLEYSDRGGQVAVQVPSPTYTQTGQARTAGGNPVWLEAATGSGYTVVNFEQIAVWNPDKVFLIVWYTLNPKEVIATLKADTQWQSIKAVKDQEIYVYPSDIYGWDTPEPRWILGTTWLATKMHPDRFANVDMVQEIHDFFGTLYGMDKASVEQNILPKVWLEGR